MMNIAKNKFFETFIESYVTCFRSYCATSYDMEISGLLDFIKDDDVDVASLVGKLKASGFHITFSNSRDVIDEIRVRCKAEDASFLHFEYRIENLVTVIDLSSKTGISVVGILLMQIVSMFICKSKTLYKAIVLDLDDTLWKGTLAEDGLEGIARRLRSEEALPFLSFMRFVKVMAKELGLYVAICSRNDIKMVEAAISTLSETEFPIKKQIDCIVANNNDKSKNIIAIAKAFSILPRSMVFIDDNPLVRDEVRKNVPEVFVPDWSTHSQLTTLLIACCVFERPELSMKSRNRKRQLRELNQEREKCDLPSLFVKNHQDPDHEETLRLYAKSNQFRFAEKKIMAEECTSMFFEIYRDNGESLGICSALTYSEDENSVFVRNWAISCRYFEIGLEEYVLMYILSFSKGRQIVFSYDASEHNGKTRELIEKYRSGFSQKEGGTALFFSPDNQLIQEIQLNTNLREHGNG